MKRFIILLLMVPLCRLTQARSYFQQEVAYDIDARLNPIEHTIHADEGFMYVNNGPDTLNTLYFHLYMNRYKQGAFHPEQGVRQETIGEIVIEKMWQNGACVKDYIIDRTLMRVPLHRALLPGDTLYMRFEFTVHLPPAAGRYGYNGDHHDVGNWYVTPVVYDQNGWHLHQHIENEFYQEWGRFDVRLTVPKGFVVGATGNLQNPDSALTDTTRAVHEWFVNHPDDSTHFTTWHYIAERVHDFAWTADPEYRYYTESIRGVQVHYLVMRSNYEAWIKEIRAGTGAVEWLSKLVGPYPYKQITVADTYIHAGGMEYPQIVFINTWLGPRFSVSFFRAVVIHEIAHNWFYGLLASNQTEDEWMDEGFTQFMEIEIMERLYGVRGNMNGNMHGAPWMRHFQVDIDDRGGSMRNYLRSVLRPVEVDPVFTMPDHFRGGISVASYDKTAVILAMLENVLSKDLFWKAMRAYYRRWHYRHPQPRDMIRVFEDVAGRPLKWFFDQWLRSIRTYDVAVEKVDVRKQGGAYINRIELANKGDIYMPLDLLCVLENGDSLLYRVPIDSFGRRVDSRRYLPYWYFTEKLYKAVIRTASPVVRVVADPEKRLADINRLNNSNHVLPPQKITFMRSVLSFPPLDAYAWEVWPTAIYGTDEGIKPGLRFDGAYLNIRHRITGAVYQPLKKQAPDGFIRYNDPLTFISRRLQWRAQLFRIDGIAGVSARMSWRDGRRYAVNFTGEWYKAFKHFSPETGIPEKDVTAIGAEWIGSDTDWGVWRMRVSGSTYGSAFTFLKSEATYHNSWQAGKGDYTLILNGRLGFSRGILPGWDRFVLYGANGRTWFNNPWYRAVDFSENNSRLYMKQGAAVRGSQLTGEAVALQGGQVAQLSLDLLVPSAFRALSGNLDNRLFFDTGLVWDNTFRPENRVISAGFELHYRPPYLFSQLFGLNNVVAGFPLYVSHKGYVQRALAWRWLVSLEWNMDRTPFFDELK